ncbi:maleylpyruvate isomerase family mycothiol-dependent enzyme [Sphaerisporangium krabiense]|uniref:Uncharacterized protein (TIGR03083 family) n=1 Tax=Sphaerisporangium krabiense TaxID=763782 RepID=A0A7W8Z6C4_9ACTN|nr:maleylpyruvate isomerase family mycothiol-dependent enzyme [Sphaerisporangium krabiense]MBB5628289.1 uncharacterized protein (TIGR03083 family) [Sphaerisporangium krabiense]
MNVAESLTYERFIAAAEAETSRMAAAAREAGPEAPVPTCPGWSVTKLLKHLGIVQRWAAHIVGERVQVPVGTRQVPVELPGDPGDYPGWLEDGGRALAATLRAAGPGAPVWSWGPGGTAGFWARRMAHEAAVHRADAEIAAGLAPRFDARLAADGVDEFLGNLGMVPAVAERLAALGEESRTLHFHATDLDGAGEWLVRLTPGGFTWEHGHGKGDVAARGTASDLLLLVYGRSDPASGRVEVLGDEGLLTRWLAATPL